MPGTLEVVNTRDAFTALDAIVNGAQNGITIKADGVALQTDSSQLTANDLKIPGIVAALENVTGAAVGPEDAHLSHVKETIAQLKAGSIEPEAALASLKGDIAGREEEVQQEQKKENKIAYDKALAEQAEANAPYMAHAAEVSQELGGVVVNVDGPFANIPVAEGVDRIALAEKLNAAAAAAGVETQFGSLHAEPGNNGAISFNPYDPKMVEILKANTDSLVHTHQPEQGTQAPEKHAAAPEAAPAPAVAGAAVAATGAAQAHDAVNAWLESEAPKYTTPQQAAVIMAETTPPQSAAPAPQAPEAHAAETSSPAPAAPPPPMAAYTQDAAPAPHETTQLSPIDLKSPIPPREHFDSMTPDEVATTKGVQQRLTDLGVDVSGGGKIANGGIDGKPGDLTAHAVKEFQEQHGLPPTGIIDDKTVAKLEAVHAEKFPEKHQVASKAPEEPVIQATQAMPPVATLDDAKVPVIQDTAPLIILPPEIVAKLTPQAHIEVSQAVSRISEHLPRDVQQGTHMAEHGAPSAVRGAGVQREMARA